MSNLFNNNLRELCRLVARVLFVNEALNRKISITEVYRIAFKVNFRKKSLKLWSRLCKKRALHVAHTKARSNVQGKNWFEYVQLNSKIILFKKIFRLNASVTNKSGATNLHNWGILLIPDVRFIRIRKLQI